MLVIILAFLRSYDLGQGHKKCILLTRQTVQVLDELHTKWHMWKSTYVHTTKLLQHTTVMQYVNILTYTCPQTDRQTDVCRT